MHEKLYMQGNYQHLLWSHRVCEVEFIFSEGSQASGQRVDGLAFVNEDVVGESPAWESGLLGPS